MTAHDPRSRESCSATGVGPRREAVGAGLVEVGSGTPRPASASPNPHPVRGWVKSDRGARARGGLGARWALGASIGSFVGLMAVAVMTYPGGTWIDPRHPGFHYRDNFLCDLLLPVAINGAPNPLASVTSQLAMLALVAGFGPFWLAVPRHFATRDARLGRWVRALGVTSLAGMVGVPLTTSVAQSWLHSICIVAAAVPGLLAAALAIVGTARNSATSRWLPALGALALVTSAVDVALYVAHVLRDDAVTAVVPGLQKVAVALVLAWLTAVAVLSPAVGVTGLAGDDHE